MAAVMAAASSVELSTPLSEAQNSTASYDTNDCDTILQFAVYGEIVWE